MAKYQADMDDLSSVLEKFQATEETEYKVVRSLDGGSASKSGDMLILDSRWVKLYKSDGHHDQCDIVSIS